MTRAWAAALLLLAPAVADGAFVIYSGRDPGVGPGQAAPSSTTAATEFDAAAPSVAPFRMVNFGTLATGYGGPTDVDPGVTMSLSGTETKPPAGYTYGVTSDHPSAQLGYAVTSTEGHFLRLVPDSVNPGVTAASASFEFSTPITAFGLYVTGLGTGAGTLQIVIDQGDAAPLVGTLVGSPVGGVQFFGFTDPDLAVTGVSLVMTGFNATTRDIIGLDGITYGTVFTAAPEPSSLGLGIAAIGLLSLRSCLGRVRRR